MLQINNLYLGDCFDKLNEVKDNSVDLIILDPEYQNWCEFINKGIIELAMSKLNNTGNIICFTKQSCSGGDLKLRIAVDPFFKREIIWKYNLGVKYVGKTHPLSSYQKIYWLCKDKKNHYFNPRTGLDYNASTKSHKRKSVTINNNKYEGKYFEKSPEGTWMKDSYEFNISRIKKMGIYLNQKN